MAQQQTYFEQVYDGPWKGINVAMPENKIEKSYTPFATNWVPRGGELRSRMRLKKFIPGLPDNSIIRGLSSFVDQNNVVHTVAISQSGVYQLNSNWRKFPGKEWSLVYLFTSPYSLPPSPASIQVFLNQLYFVVGDNNLYDWDGIALSTLSGLNIQGARTSTISFIVGETITQATTGATAVVTFASQAYMNISTLAGGGPNSSNIWTGGTSGATFKPTTVPTKGGAAVQSIAVVDTVNNLRAGAYFLGELNSRLILLNTLEQLNASGKPISNFTQRIRWSASGLPGIWDPTVNVDAGYNDELDVPDSITGFLTIGRNGFVFRTNGITEMIGIASGLLPFDFNHLWASERGIGNVYPYSIAGYGPVGCFISTDDIYEISLGGFQKIGGSARNAIFSDLELQVATPVASLFPSYRVGYPYLTYKINIPMTGGVTKNWAYFIEDSSWFAWTTVNSGLETAKCIMVPTI